MGVNLASENDVAFTCICREPEGDVLRTVRLLEFTPENLRKLWAQVSKFRTFMGYEVKNIEDMLRIFLTEDTKPKGLCLVIDDFIGLFFLTDINGLFEASVHYTFFDRRHKGRVELCKKALKYAFEQFNFQRLSTSVPEYEQKVTLYVQSLGFKYTGRHRKNRLIRGKLFDTFLYDMLREEFLNGEPERGLQTANNTSNGASESAQV